MWGIVVYTVMFVNNINATHVATAEVNHIHICSHHEVTATGRQHACPEEPLVFTCEVNGLYIQWMLNSYYHTTFFYDQSILSRVQTVSGQYVARAILTANDPIPTNPTADSMARRLT